MNNQLMFKAFFKKINDICYILNCYDYDYYIYNINGDQNNYVANVKITDEEIIPCKFTYYNIGNEIEKYKLKKLRINKLKTI